MENAMLAQVFAITNKATVNNLVYAILYRSSYTADKFLEWNTGEGV